MGKLVYGGSSIEIEIDDRALTHLQIVIGSKLRRGESFFFSWKDDPSVGDGRSSLWMDRTIPLYFKYSGGRTPSINRGWIEVLTDAANSGRGLIYVDEPEASPSPPPKVRNGSAH